MGRWVATLALLVCCPLGACGEPPLPDRPVVLVSVAPQAWFVEQLAGDAVDIGVLIPPAADPHAFEPTVRQMQEVARAALWVEVGHPAFAFEAAWAETLLSENASLRVVGGDPDAASGADPHLWLSPRRALAQAERVAAALADLLPVRRDELLARRDALRREVLALEAELAALLEPCRGMEVYVFHPAWGAFCEDFGLVQVPIQHGHHEPSAGHLAEVIARGREAGAAVVFVQPQLSTRSAQVVADQLGARLVTVDPLSRDWPGSLRHMATALRAAWDEQS